MFLFTALVMCLVNIESSLTYIIDDLRGTINVYEPPSVFSYGEVESHKYGSYDTGRNTTLILSAPPGYGIQVAFQFLDLRPNSQDTLRLFDVKQSFYQIRYSNALTYRFKQNFPSENTYTFYAPNGQLGVTFTTGPYGSESTYGYKGFKFTYTVQGLRIGDCGSFAFYCSNGNCIDGDLKCNGHNNCGDRSDERNCVTTTSDYYDINYDINTGRYVGVSFAVAFLIIAVACGIFIVIRRNSRTRTEVRTLHPPPVYPPTEPGVYYPPPPPAYSATEGVNPGYH